MAIANFEKPKWRPTAAATTTPSRCWRRSRFANFCRASGSPSTWPARWSSGPKSALPAATRRPPGEIWRQPIASAVSRKPSANSARNTPSGRFGEVRRNLAAGQPQAALAELEQLQRRGLFDETAAALSTNCQASAGGRAAAAHGHFARGRSDDFTGPRLNRQARRPKRVQWRSPGTSRCGHSRSPRTRSGRPAARGELHAALDRQDWGAVLSAAEAVLAIAPQHEAARQARRQAWKAVGMDVTQAVGGRRLVGPVSLKLDRVANVGRPPVDSPCGSARVRLIPCQATKTHKTDCCGSTPSAASWSAWTTRSCSGSRRPADDRCADPGRSVAPTRSDPPRRRGLRPRTSATR